MLDDRLKYVADSFSDTGTKVIRCYIGDGVLTFWDDTPLTAYIIFADEDGANRFVKKFGKIVNGPPEKAMYLPTETEHIVAFRQDLLPEMVETVRRHKRLLST